MKKVLILLPCFLMGFINYGQETIEQNNYCANPFEVNFPENCEKLNINYVLEGADNFRPITVAKNSEIKIKKNTLYRADALNQLTTKDVAYLENLGIKTVIDFRTETSDEPDVKLKTVKLWMNPGISEDGGGFMSNFDDETGKMVGKWFYSGNFHKIDSILKAKKIDYVTQKSDKYATLPHFTEEYSIFMKTLADKKNYPIVFHCQGGATRTGFASTIVMKLLGYADEDIYNDFLASNVYGVKPMKAMFPEDLKHLAKSFSVFKAHLQSSFKTIEREYGSFDNYLQKGLKLTHKEILKIKNNLLVK